MTTIQRVITAAEVQPGDVLNPEGDYVASVTRDGDRYIIRLEGDRLGDLHHIGTIKAFADTLLTYTQEVTA